MFKSILTLFVLFGVGLFTSCSDNEPQPIGPTDFSVTKTGNITSVRNLNADYAPLVPSSDPAKIPPTRPAEKKKYTFFSFKTGQIVPNSDSASTKWDIGFRSTSIIFNGGTSGPGTAGAIVQQGLFDEIKEAPTSGYVMDNKTTNKFAVSSSPFVVGTTTTTNNWWLNSGTQTSTIISPIAGRVIIIKTADDRYAKMEILSYYKGTPATVDNTKDIDRHYTFRYIYQPENKTSF